MILIETQYGGSYAQIAHRRISPLRAAARGFAPHLVTYELGRGPRRRTHLLEHWRENPALLLRFLGCVQWFRPYELQAR
jgi:hypothetical protein